MNVMGDIYYFGGWPKGLGYNDPHFYLPSGHPQGNVACPWTEDQMDSSFCPSDREQGAAKLTHIIGWTVLAFWDKTSGMKGVTNSAFVAKGTFTYKGMIRRAQKYYPNICKRIGTIRLLEPKALRVGYSLGVDDAKALAEWPVGTRSGS